MGGALAPAAARPVPLPAPLRDRAPAPRAAPRASCGSSPPSRFRRKDPVPARRSPARGRTGGAVELRAPTAQPATIGAAACSAGAASAGPSAICPGPGSLAPPAAKEGRGSGRGGGRGGSPAGCGSIVSAVVKIAVSGALPGAVGMTKAGPHVRGAWAGVILSPRRGLGANARSAGGSRIGPPLSSPMMMSPPGGYHKMIGSQEEPPEGLFSARLSSQAGAP